MKTTSEIVARLHFLEERIKEHSSEIQVLGLQLQKSLKKRDFLIEQEKLQRDISALERVASKEGAPETLRKNLTAKRTLFQSNQDWFHTMNVYLVHTMRLGAVLKQSVNKRPRLGSLEKPEVQKDLKVEKPTDHPEERGGMEYLLDMYRAEVKDNDDEDDDEDDED